MEWHQGEVEGKVGVMFVPLVFSAENVLSKAVCPLSGTETDLELKKIRWSFCSILVSG